MSVHRGSSGRKALAVTELHGRQMSDEQIQTFEGYVAEIFTAVGLNLDTPATRGAPQRFVEAGASMIMIESEGITENVQTWRTDLAAQIVDAVGLDKIMFEAAEPAVFAW